MCNDDSGDVSTGITLDPVVIGDVYRLQVYITDKLGQPFEASGATFDFGYGVTSTSCARENQGKASATPALGTVVVDGVSYACANIAIGPTETAALLADVSYVWALRMTLNGDPEVIASGTFPVAAYPL